MNKALIKRIIRYIIGLFILTAGIALSVKSDQGVSPVSAPPYTASLCIGISIGTATVIFHVILVILQLILLRSKFKPKSLLQIPTGIVFGYLTDLSCSLVDLIPSTEVFILRTVITLVSIVVTAIGIYVYLSADIMPLAVEGFIKALTDVTERSFALMKTISDVTMAILSAAVCFILLKSLGSVGIGTVLSALLTGYFIDLSKKAERALLKKKESKAS